MKKQKLILWVFMPLLALVAIGYIVPTVISKDGTAGYVASEKEYAQAAIDDVKLQLSSPSVYRLYTTNLKVTELSATRNIQCPYMATVQSYTYFGIENKSMKWDVLPGCSAKSSAK